MHKEEGLSFKNVITFNLDQYYPMNKDALQSYHYFMRNNFFSITRTDEIPETLYKKTFKHDFITLPQKSS